MTTSTWARRDQRRQGLQINKSEVDPEVRAIRSAQMTRRDIEMRKQAAEEQVNKIKDQLAKLDVNPLKEELERALRDAKLIAAELAQHTEEHGNQ